MTLLLLFGDTVADVGGPPPQHPARGAIAAAAIVAAWQTPVAVPPKSSALPPGIPGQSIDNPPIGIPNDLALPTIIATWQPRPPDPYFGAGQALEPHKL